MKKNSSNNKNIEEKKENENNANEPVSKKEKSNRNEENEENDILKNKKNSSKNDYKDINYMNKYLSENCKDFFEKFELLESLKSGVSGAVYKGKLRNKPNSRQIAFKFLFDNTKENKKGNENLKNKNKDSNKHFEISVHGVLKNKHIAEIFGYYKIKENSCIAMEFCKFGDLENFKRKVINRTILSETLILYIAGGIIEALNYIHTNNKIIHMDIKQQNILVAEFLNIKLTDFSVSINYKNAKDSINLPLAGTCYYMSPEVLNRQRILVSEASKIDIYSLGVLLYLLTFHDYPYKLKDVNNEDFQQIAKNIKINNLEFPENINLSKVFKHFLQNCLNKDIKKRYDIYQAMKDPWFKGYKIILDEKEKLLNDGKFLIELMTDKFIKFNDYIKNQERLL